MIKKIIKKYIPYSGLEMIRLLKMKVLPPKPIFNLYGDSNLKKRVLISYLTVPFYIKSYQRVTHSNHREAICISEVFRELGYIIDVLPCNSPFHPIYDQGLSYDIVFGFGPNFEYFCQKNNAALKIVYLTESHPNFSKSQEQKRLDYYYERHKKRESLARSGKYLTNQMIKLADVGILIGNEVTHSSYIKNGVDFYIYLIKPTGLCNNSYEYKIRDLSESKKNFLWLGSHGAIHKGLDLLIDAFKNLPDFNLYIAGLNSEEEWLLNNITENVHNLGFIDIQSDEFLKLADECSFMIFPSCSEGTSTSVITSMYHSIIPIITRECGIDLGEQNILLDSCCVERIIETINQASKIENFRLERMHYENYKISQKEFNLNQFKKNFKQVITKILI